MKRRDLIRHLEAHGCEYLRQGGNHTVYINRVAQKASAIPRHRIDTCGDLTRRLVD
ncbi:MAG: addiction module toxin, HicA family [Candidatus Methylomirabilota bacterium]|nr:MAG: addiction module toxin, HicA family [candidate division NC10 bacterium]